VAHAVVVGGGVVGLCAGRALVERGWDVTVVDAGAPGHGATHGNAGWVVPGHAGPVPGPGVGRALLRSVGRPASPLYLRPRADPAFLRWLLAFRRSCTARAHRAGLEATLALAADTFPLFARLAEELRAVGTDPELRGGGVLYAYASPRELARDLTELDGLGPVGADAPVPLDGDAARALEPALTDAVVGGYRLPGERSVRPDRLAEGLVRLLRARGATVRGGTPVTGIEHRGGVVTAVESRGERFPAEAVLLCAGAWLPAVARLAGARVPIEAGTGYSLDYAPPPRPVAHRLYLHEARVAVTPFAGFVRLAGTMEFSGLGMGGTGRINPARVAAIARAGARYLRGWPADPAVAAAPWAGARPVTPDGLPVIGLLPGFRNLAVAGGHAMLGVTLAPATAEAVAALLADGRAPAALRPFDPARFGG
jgi:D-amino-acid dehydrogenase